ncbi:MAG TPA: hypothetical protein VEC11_06350 [Allosphingosinicella sp.]|nr:hypothetical protein [Allosphingosinicella sp.]
MRKMLISGVAAVMCAAAPPAAAQADFSPASQEANQSGSESAQPTQQQRTRAGDQNRRVCVADRLSDSRIRRRICRTQAEWDALQANDNDGLGVNR